MAGFTRAAAAAFAFSFMFMASADAADPTTVKVALVDMTAVFGPSSGGGPGSGVMGQGYGMMGPGNGMMGRGMMGGMSIRINKASIKAGKVTFDVTNFSRSIVHEMIVVAVDNPNAPLPYDYNTARIPEEQIKMLGETAEMQPNAEKIVTLDQPGSFLLICNVPGHYAADMWTPLTVTQ